MEIYNISYHGEDVVKLRGRTLDGKLFTTIFKIDKVDGDLHDPKKITGEGLFSIDGDPYPYYVTEYRRGKGFKWGKQYL